MFVNRLGSHLIGLSSNVDGESEIVVWSMENDAHRHMVKNKGKFIAGFINNYVHRRFSFQ